MIHVMTDTNDVARESRRWIAVTFTDTELNALARYALAERRDTRATAALIVRAELERVGLLEPLIPSRVDDARS